MTNMGRFTNLSSGFLFVFRVPAGMNASNRRHKSLLALIAVFVRIAALWRLAPVLLTPFFTELSMRHGGERRLASDVDGIVSTFNVGF